MFDQTSLDHRPRRVPGRIHGSAHIVSCLRSCGSAAWQSPYSASSSSSSPSNGSLNCIGSLYGASNANGLGGSGFLTSATRLPVGKALADDAPDRALSAFDIVDAQGDPVAVAEIKLGEIAVQVFLAAMLVDAAHPALEDREKAFNGVGMCRAAHVLVDRVVDGFVTGETPPDAAIGTVLIGHQIALGVGVREHDLAQFGSGDVFSLDRAGLAAALDKGNDRNFGASAARRSHASLIPALFVRELPRIDALGAFLSTPESLVDFDDFASAANRPEHIGMVCHCLTDAMADEPAGFEIDAERAAELVCREAFFAAAHNVHRLKPNVHGHMAFFEDGVDLYGEWFAAGIAFVSANPGALAFQRAALVYDAAMRTDPTIRPNDSLDIGIGSLFVAEAGLVKNGLRHRLSPCKRLYNA